MIRSSRSTASAGPTSPCTWRPPIRSARPGRSCRRTSARRVPSSTGSTASSPTSSSPSTAFSRRTSRSTRAGPTRATTARCTCSVPRSTMATTSTPRCCASGKPSRWPPPWLPPCAMVGPSATAPAGCGRAGPATSPCCCRPARRCRCSSRRSPAWPCRTAPRTRRSSTWHRRSATCCWRCAPPPIRRTRWRSSPACARRCTAAAMSSCSTGAPAAGAGTCSPTLPRRWPTIRSDRRSLTSVRSPPTSVASTPAELLDRIVEERRVLETALAGPDARDVWRRVRYVVDQARAWTDAGGRGVRRYLRWAAYQAAEGRASDTILPEHDHDAVRVMTVHAAKGLEFPITVVSGLTTRVQGTRAMSVVWPGDGWALAERDSALFEAYKPLDEQMGDAERRRLLYVACTRAVDHLVVSLHRKPENVADGTARATSATVLAEAGALGHGAVPIDAAADPLARDVGVALELPWSDATAWDAERSRAMAAASVRSATSATRLAVALDGGGARGPTSARAARRRPGQGRRRPRPPAVAARPLRHGHRPSRARRAAGRRPRRRHRHRAPRRRPVRRRGDLRLRGAGRRPVPLGPRRADRRHGRGGRRALARAVRRRRARGPRWSRATSTCSCARRRGW